jgi:tetratricopeptide (TPR) repeat protein
VLERAAAGSGGLLILVGAPGAGKTAMVEAAAGEARRRGFDVLRASPPQGQPGRLVWAQLLHDAGVPESSIAGLLADDPGPLDLDAAARHLVSRSPRLIVVDDVDHGGADAAEMLSVVAARCVTAPTAVITTTTTPLGLGRELRLGGLSEEELVSALGGLDAEAGHALWVASRGLPGVARALARELAGLGGNDDPVVHLALRAASTVVFLDVDASLVRLLEEAAERADGDGTRARVLARLAGELLGDTSAANRRRELIDEALTLARRAGDPGTLAEVLDARLHALWDPAGAEDRLAAGSEIIDLARAAGDDRRERHGQFWRFVAHMELGRVAEAESALAAFEREAATAGDAEAAVIVTARHAMLAVLRGRFERASELIEDVASMGRRAGLADVEALTGTLAWSVLVEQGTPPTAAGTRLLAGLATTGVLNKTLGLPVTAEQDTADVAEAAASYLLAAASRQPGHFFEATAARMLLWLGRDAEAGAELDRLLPRALASSGPRWVGAMADLVVVAAAVGNTSAAVQLYEALAPYQGGLVVYAGANTCWGPVSHYLGLLAAAVGRTGEAVKHFEDATDLEQQAGALPFLAHSLSGLADALAARAAGGDPERASAHRRRAREIAERLGMTALRERLVPRPMSGRSLGTATTGCWQREMSGPACGMAGASITCVRSSRRRGGTSGPWTLSLAGPAWQRRGWARSSTPRHATPTSNGWTPSPPGSTPPTGRGIRWPLSGLKPNGRRCWASYAARRAWAAGTGCSRPRRSGRESTSPGRSGPRSSGWRRPPRAPLRTCEPPSAPAVPAGTSSPPAARAAGMSESDSGRATPG